jgi:hypothetical protein
MQAPTPKPTASKASVGRMPMLSQRGADQRPVGAAPVAIFRGGAAQLRQQALPERRLVDEIDRHGAVAEHLRCDQARHRDPRNLWRQRNQQLHDRGDHERADQRPAQPEAIYYARGKARADQRADAAAADGDAKFGGREAEVAQCEQR